MKATASSWSIQLDPVPTAVEGKGGNGDVNSDNRPTRQIAGGTSFSIQQDGKSASQQLTSTPLSFPAGSSATVTAAAAAS